MAKLSLNSLHSVRLALVAGTIALCPATFAAPDSPELTDVRALRATFRRTLINAILPEKRAHLETVRDLEKQLATAHDYAGAIRARDERIALEQELTAFEQELPMLDARAAGSGQVLPERIPFKPQDAVLNGVTLDKDGAISGWTSSRCSATWKLPTLPPGGYEVILKYSCGVNDGGEFVIRESFYHLTGRTAPTGDKKTEKNFGTLRINDGQGMITLATELSPKSSLMRLWSFELAPASR